MPISARKAQASSKRDQTDGFAALLQLPGMNGEIVRQMQRQKIKSLSGELPLSPGTWSYEILYAACICVSDQREDINVQPGQFTMEPMYRPECWWNCWEYEFCYDSFPQILMKISHNSQLMWTVLVCVPFADLVALEKERVQFLDRLRLPNTVIEDIDTAIAALPQLTVTAECVVDGEEGIIEGDMVTCRVWGLKHLTKL